MQVTREKEVVFIFDDIIITKYTGAKFQKDGIVPARFNTKRENLTTKYIQHRVLLGTRPCTGYMFLI